MPESSAYKTLIAQMVYLRKCLNTTGVTFVKK